MPVSPGSLLLRTCRRVCERMRIRHSMTSTCIPRDLGTETSARGDAGVTSGHTEPAAPHTPVMVDTVTQLIDPQPGQLILDMTFGAGGHTKAILERCPDSRLYCLDRDPTAYRLAQDLADKTPTTVTPLLGRFTDVPRLLAPHGLQEHSVDGVLVDAGASSMQFDDAERGFSLSRDGPLDMRMDQSSDSITAADVVNSLNENELYKIFKKYGEEKNARQIAQAIVDRRYAFGRIKTTHQLASTVASACSHPRHDKLHRPAHTATKVFQALRIFVNDELNELHNCLTIANHLLKPGGICITISFHSLEDRIIKRHFAGGDINAKFNQSIADHHRAGRQLLDQREMTQVLHSDWRLASKGAVTATDEEVEANPRARSAKLRAAYKV